MLKRMVVIGDPTTTGGSVLNASNRRICLGKGMAVVGSSVYCPKCDKVGVIAEGAKTFIIDGKEAVYDGCAVACGCKPYGINRVIASHCTMMMEVKDRNEKPKSTIVNSNQTVVNSTSTYQSSDVNQQNTVDKKYLIRQDAKRLLQCADELCEKHLYHDDIKQSFKAEVKQFADDIIYQVDTGNISYTEGAEAIKEEEKSLWEQSYEWLINGLSILGGIGMFTAGLGLCSTGPGCMIGAPLMAHGVNDIYEGTMGIYNGLANIIDGGERSLSVDGILKDSYQKTAQMIGFDSSVGTIAYDLVNFGISVHGKLKLVPKINDLGNPIRKLWYFGKRDLERAYLQMKKKLLAIEIGSDIISAFKISGEMLAQKNAFVLSEDKQNVNMVVNNPEKISNVKDIIENCTLVITITGNNDNIPGYFRCESSDGTTYNKDYDGNILNR